MKVGIFFKVGNEFLIDAVPVADGEPYGEAVMHGGHYEFHERLIPSTPLQRRFRACDYDYYPRGRVVCSLQQIHFASMPIPACPRMTSAADRIIRTGSRKGRNRW